MPKETATPVRAVFPDGVFRPLQAVNLPENTRVVFDPTLVDTIDAHQSNQEKIFEILRRNFASGETDVAERHDEHQP